jgi:predicted aspartyl protease
MRTRCRFLITLALLVPAVAAAEVPLHWDSTGHVVVPTIVDGTGPVDFIFDTGADDTSVFDWLAKRLMMPGAGSGTIDGATGTAPASLSRVFTLALDGHGIEGLLAVTMPDRPDAPTLGGIVGADLMTGRLAVLDLGCNTTALLPLNSPQLVLGKHAQLIRAGSIKGGKQLTLPVTINNATGLALLDSGARASIINLRFASAAGVDPASAAFHDGEPTAGATRTSVASRSGPVGTVRFAGITRPEANVRVADLPFLTDAHLADTPVMVLGLDLLRGTRVSVDYASRRLWIAPSRCTVTTAHR